MDPVSAYLDAAAARLSADGCTVEAENWSGARVIVGYRGDFRLRWMATKLHLITAVAAAPFVRAEDIEGFTNAVMDYALARKGQFRGLQSGVAVFPALVSANVDPAAVAWAAQRQRVRFACMARPVVVDVAHGAVGSYRGTPGLGWVYAGHLRAKLASYFPSAITETGSVQTLTEA
jgi:hypothetical protein